MTAEITEQPYQRTSGPVHGWFGLTYSNYQVVPRVLAQSMPVEWQTRFVACLEQLSEAFAHVDQPEDYEVTPGEWIYVDELSDAQMRLVGVTRALDDKLAEEFPRGSDADPEAYDARYLELEDEWGSVFYSARGDEMRSPERVFVPGRDPLPHYRHSYIEPASYTAREG